MSLQTGEVAGSSEKESARPSNPRISFVIPAHNEQAVIGRTLQAVHEAARAVEHPYEIIVVNDASTDATAEIARQHDATVVTVNHRQIAATRNSGARAAKGDWLFFVDADTVINAEAVASAMRQMQNGAVGGGAPVRFDGVLPLYARLITPFSGVASKLIGFTGGAFMFCTRRAFQATGGFNERLYWAEEGGFAMALKGEGRFVVLWKTVLTSGRRFRTLSIFGLPAFIARAILSPVKTFTRRSSVQKIWYDSNREHDEKPPSSFSMRVSNGILLLVTIALIMGPVLIFVPWSLTPHGTALGKIRRVVGIFLAHFGLLLWPCAVVLLANLFRRKYWLEWIKLAALTAFCFWQAWNCTGGVIWTWAQVYHWLGQFV